MNAQQIELAKKNGTIDVIYGETVNKKIRQKYSLSDELAILRQRDNKPADFAAYNDFVEKCKEEAKAELGIDTQI